MAVSLGIQNAHKLGRFLVDENDFNDGICAYGCVSNNRNYEPEMEYDDWDDNEMSMVGGDMSAPCHANLNSIGDVYGGRTKFIVDAMYPCGVNHNVREAYLSYILMSSPYAEAFAEKNIHEGIKRGYFIYRADVDANLMTATLVSVRMLSEYPHIPKNWYALVQAGCDENMALLLSSMIRIDKPRKTISILRNPDTCHIPISPSEFSEEDATNYLNGSYSSEGTYQDNLCYSGFSSEMWRRDGFNGFSREFLDTLIAHWIEAKEALTDVIDKRVALFNHEHNRINNENILRAPLDEGIKVLAEMANNYRSLLCPV